MSDPFIQSHEQLQRMIDMANGELQRAINDQSADTVYALCNVVALLLDAVNFLSKSECAKPVEPPCANQS